MTKTSLVLWGPTDRWVALRDRSFASLEIHKFHLSSVARLLVEGMQTLGGVVETIGSIISLSNCAHTG